MSNSTTQKTIDAICGHLILRSGDPWSDELWPQARAVLMTMARELHDDDTRTEIELEVELLSKNPRVAKTASESIEFDLAQYELEKVEAKGWPNTTQ